MNNNQAQGLDGQGRVIVGDGPFHVQKDLALSASNTTVNPAIFTLTGGIQLFRFWGEVITDLSSNITAAYARLNDQSAQVNLSLNTGVVLSAIKAGSLIVKKGLVGAALVKVDNVAGAVSEPTTLETMIFSPIIILKKTAATTQIEFVYTSTNTPATGLIRFHAEYKPLTTDGLLVAA